MGGFYCVRLYMGTFRCGGGVMQIEGLTRFSDKTHIT